MGREPDRLGEPAFEKEERELQTRLAKILRRLALTPQEINSLPSNYALALASGQFAKEYDPEHRDRPFLPPDLFDPRGPWVEIYEPGAPFGSGQIVPQHADTFSRSTFLVFMRLPAGRKATFDYIRALWDFPRPWLPRFDVSANDQTVENPELPQFPAGTQFALVRQLMLFDQHGNLQGTPISESVQIRVYRKIALGQGSFINDLAENSEKSGQDFYEFVLSRPQLFAENAGGLRATRRDEREFAIFNAFGPDMGSAHQRIPLDKYSPVLQQCVECHHGPGINSVNSRGHLLKPFWLNHPYPERANDPQISWWVDEEGALAKRKRYDWGLLNGYWNSSPDK